MLFKSLTYLVDPEKVLIFQTLGIRPTVNHVCPVMASKIDGELTKVQAQKSPTA
jgi:hypothetical protein